MDSRGKSTCIFRAGPVTSKSMVFIAALCRATSRPSPRRVEPGYLVLDPFAGSWDHSDSGQETWTQLGISFERRRNIRSRLRRD